MARGYCIIAPVLNPKICHTLGRRSKRLRSGWFNGARNVRLHGVYLDYTSLLLVDPHHVTVSDSFFLGMGTVVVRLVVSGIIVVIFGVFVC